METKQISALQNQNYQAAAVSLQGLNHASSDTPMQDHHALISLPNDWMLAVVADGVGSEAHSDAGSLEAAQSFAGYVKEYWGYFQDGDSLLNLLKSACLFAAGRLRQLADQANHPVNSYSTTLHAALFAGNQCFYAHAGDGGILAFTEEGELLPVTNPMRDEEYVIPLLAGPDYWQFGAVSKPVKSVMLCTDGVYDKLAGSLLRNQECRMDRALTAWFVSPWAWNPNEKPEKLALELESAFRGTKEPSFYERMARALAQGQDAKSAVEFMKAHLMENNRPIKTLQAIGDDITVAVIHRLYGAPSLQPLTYYMPPDWNQIYQNVYQILYGNSPGGGNDKKDPTPKAAPETPGEAQAPVSKDVHNSQ